MTDARPKQSHAATTVLPFLLALCTVATCALVTTPPAFAQQNSIRVVFDKNPESNSVIGAFRTKGVLYGSLTDLTQVFRIASYTNTATGKMEVKQGAYRIKVTGGNPFIVVTDGAQQTTVYQLSANVIFAANTFFIPMQTALPYFHILFDKSGRFDAATATLAIGNAPLPTAFDIPSIALEPKTNGLVIRIASQKRIDDVESWLRPDGWFYVTLADVRANIHGINALKGSGIVKKIVAIQSPTSVQLTFKLTGKIISTEIVRDEGSHDLLLSVHTPDPAPGTELQPKGPPAVDPTKESTGQPKLQPAVEPKAGPTTESQAKSTGDPQGVAATPSTADPKAEPGAEPKLQPKEEPKVPPGKKPAQEVVPDLSSHKKRWELDVIVIDPGHGGYDPGTIGVSGTKEKDITLGVGRRLGQLLKSDRTELRNVKTVFTRSTDTFIPLYRRGQMANESGGKLFVSIHCNSTARKPNPQRGFEVYLLRPGRTEEAIAIAERENAVIELEEGYENRYQELTDENFILVTMAQSAYMRSSERLAELVQKQMASVAGLVNHGVKQAGFFVLVGAAMPNILVETAYLSNREDEKFLRSSAGQQKVAEALYRAIRKYKTEYEKLLANE